MVIPSLKTLQTMENNTSTSTTAREAVERNTEFMDLEHQERHEEYYVENDHYEQNDENASTMSFPESNGPNYGVLIESIKELSTTLDEMYEQVFKLELDMAELTMQSAIIYEPSVLGFVLDSKEYGLQDFESDTNLDDKLMEILPKYSSMEINGMEEGDDEVY